MEAALDDRTSLQIRRTFKAPVAAVYAAWTDPEEVKQWMAPSDDFGPTDATIDLRVGGRYRFVMRGPDGEMHRVGGVYREIVPNRKLVYTWAWESTPERESLVMVEFRPAGEGSELVLTHTRFFDTEARDRHGHGWNGCLERFSRYVSRD
jgi:uncharacterized protein YndB with AHSA1/START domain